MSPGPRLRRLLCRYQAKGLNFRVVSDDSGLPELEIEDLRIIGFHHAFGGTAPDGPPDSRRFPFLRADDDDRPALGRAPKPADEGGSVRAGPALVDHDKFRHPA